MVTFGGTEELVGLVEVETTAGFTVVGGTTGFDETGTVVTVAGLVAGTEDWSQMVVVRVTGITVVTTLLAGQLVTVEAHSVMVITVVLWEV